VQGNRSKEAAAAEKTKQLINKGALTLRKGRKIYA
jgi:hypothetical protein